MHQSKSTLFCKGQFCCSEFIFSVFYYSAINAAEKVEIKSLLLSESFQEPVPQISSQMAVLFGIISRYDYPQEWTEVIGT